MRKFKRFNKKGFNNRGKKPPFKKGGQSSSLFKARCFECNSTYHLVVDCPKGIEKEKGALEAKLEALKKKKKGKGLIGTWDQDSSESKEEEKANICFMALENEVQSSPSNSSNLIDNICDDDLCTMLIEMYGECKKCSNNDFQILALGNKKLCEKVHTLEKSMVDYDVLKEKVSDLTICVAKFTKGKKTLKNFSALKDHLLIKMVLDIMIPIISQNKHGL
ncbi:hypothetical protein M9H77_34753 [Catharanthus roseus]|uniref:Uncharacterized protein n=1 Tax=Catharanthus roseus TaxID=4058 RepID=A0ACB9ZMS3_CATRO|nr:hypothetical protein M9H77_34753 [Catharanthus roseus]